MKYLLLVLATFSLMGCSYQSSKNRVAVNNVSFNGGIKNKDKWGENLQFHRITWYTGATMSYDILLGELKSDSNFRKWLSANERKMIENCEKLLFALVYAYTLDTRSSITISNQIEEMGYKRLTLPVFSAHLRGHPTFPDRNLDRHRPMGFCRLKEITPRKHNIIDVPGFESIELKI